MKYRVWYSTEPFADFVIQNTELKNRNPEKKKMYESDANNANNFHTMPDHIKKILYLDAPDLIVEIDREPIFSIEVSTEAGTGHNAFQRFARLAASVENEVPAFYIYPEAVIIKRQNVAPTWDKINPLVFKALDDVMSIYQIPALLYYYPSDFQNHQDTPQSAPHREQKGLIHESNRNFAGSPAGSSTEMQSLFQTINDMIVVYEKHGVVKGRSKLLSTRSVMSQRSWMLNEFSRKGGHMNMSPLSATIKVPTSYVLKYLSRFESTKYSIGELLRSRDETIIYKVDAAFRGDPYPGALAAIDYLVCREGKSAEERKYNLILAWSGVLVDHLEQTIQLPGVKGKIGDFTQAVQASEAKNILSKSYSSIKNHEVPRYYMQVRYGSTYSKVKHIRVFSYFADAILFPDGAIWRDS